MAGCVSGLGSELCWAVNADDNARVQAVLAQDPGAADDRDSSVAMSTALYKAILRGYFDIVQTLVRAKADVDAVTAGRVSPLNAAIECCQFDRENGNGIIRCLVEEGRASVNLPLNQRGMWTESPLMVACRLGEVDVVRYLQRRGADRLCAKDGLEMYMRCLYAAYTNGTLVEATAGVYTPSFEVKLVRDSIDKMGLDWSPGFAQRVLERHMALVQGRIAQCLQRTHVEVHADLAHVVRRSAAYIEGCSDRERSFVYIYSHSQLPNEIRCYITDRIARHALHSMLDTAPEAPVDELPRKHTWLASRGRDAFLPLTKRFERKTQDEMRAWIGTSPSQFPDEKGLKMHLQHHENRELRLLNQGNRGGEPVVVGHPLIRQSEPPAACEHGE